MRSVFQSVLALLAAAATASQARAAEPALKAAPAAPTAPAAPANSAAKPAEKPAPLPTAATERLVFGGVIQEANKVTVRLEDKAIQFNAWVAVGQSVNGIDVLKYDEAKSEVTVRVEGHVAVLKLRDASGPTMEIGPSGVVAADGSIATDPSAGQKVLTKQEMEEQEARMLVSDLLEISQIQRKAFEEKKAAEDAAKKESESGTAAPKS